MTDTTDAFRAVLKKHLKAFADDLGQFCQTTHGSLLADGSFESVLEALVRTEKAADDFGISELSQRIQKYGERDAR